MELNLVDFCKSIEDKLCEYTGIEKGSDAFNKIAWLGLFDDKPLPIEKGSPAQVMQAIMEQKMSLSPGDKDMIVMQHKFEYEIAPGQRRERPTMGPRGEERAPVLGTVPRDLYPAPGPVPGPGPRARHCNLSGPWPLQI